MRRIMTGILAVILLSLSAFTIGLNLQGAAIAESGNLGYKNTHEVIPFPQLSRQTPTPLPKIPRLGSEDEQTSVASENAIEAVQTEIYKWSRNLAANNPSFNFPFGVAIAPNENVYIVDGNNKLVRVFDGYDRYKKSFGAGQFVGPYGIAVDANNNIYVTDYDANLVRKFNKKFKLVKSWGGAGSVNSKFDSPAGIWVDGNRVFVTDVGNNRVQVFDTSGNFITKFGSYGTAMGKFINPYGVVVDNAGAVYVSDTGNNRIQKCSPLNNTFVCNQVMPGQFKSPLLLATDKDRTRIYVADSKNNQIQVFDTNWNIIAKFGAKGNAKKRMRNPVGVAITGQYQVVVADTLNNRAQLWCGYYPWNVSGGSSNGYLNGTAVVSANDIWAVGTDDGDPQVLGDSSPIILHWDGSAWSQVSSPSGGGLSSVTKLSANDVWAVGSVFETGVERIDVETLTLHYDGNSWEKVPSPNLPGSCSWMICYYPADFLNDVDFVSTNDVWAVGTAGNKTRVLHWDGSIWSAIASPNVGSGTNALHAAAAISATDIWAVGLYDADGVVKTLIFRWNGTNWSVIPSPNVGTGANALNAVSGASSSDVWAVGQYDAGGVTKTLTLHWNGIDWSVIPSPNVGTGNNSLTSVQVSAANDVWAAGEGDGKALLLHWDGSIWRIVPTPDIGASRFGGLGIVSANDVWAVGSVPNGTLIERGGLPCPRTPQ